MPLVKTSSYKMQISQNAPGEEFSVEDDPEAQEAIDKASQSEFKKLVERLKEQAKPKEPSGDDRSIQPIP